MKRIRFLMPTERLPQGLPEWFRAKDANGDGQVSMAEFATTWTDALVREFNSYDLNGDGMITPQEVLAKMAANGVSGNTRSGGSK
jgi:Ca2+-binding EF-hand superfamily protein